MAIANIHVRASERFGHANCIASDIVGNCVGISAPRLGVFFQVRTVDPGDLAGIAAVALVISKSSSTECMVQFEGVYAGPFAALGTGKRYYVGPTGQLALTPPIPAAGQIYHIQAMGFATSSNEFYIQPTQRWTRRGS